MMACNFNEMASDDDGSCTFAESGYEATSVEEIAAKAGVSKPVVYEHFGGKEGIYAVIVDREMQKLLSMIEGALTEDHPRRLLEPLQSTR